MDHFHARPLPYSHVKSREDPISSRRGDSGVLYPFIYIDLIFSVKGGRKGGLGSNSGTNLLKFILSSLVPVLLTFVMDMTPV